MIEQFATKALAQLDYLRMTNRYKNLFLSDGGKKVLRDLCILCNYDQSTFNADPIRMAFEEGRRSVILDILKKISYTVDDVMNAEMMNEED